MPQLIDVFAAVLLTQLVIAVPATLLLFVRTARRPRLGAGTRALLLALTSGLLVTLVLGVVDGPSPMVVGLVAVVLVLVWTRAADSWTTLGLAAWSATVATGLAFLAYGLTWTITTELDVLSRVGSLALVLVEAFVFILAFGYVWEMVDVLARFDWRRRAEVNRGRPAPSGRSPFVSLHVPTHNEPPDLVIETLRSLLELEYEDYEVLLLDNNTSDPELWKPVEAFCAQHERLRFFHLEDWPGYKSGALNFGLEQVDPRTELIGVVDADYQVDRDFLSACTPLFADPGLAFVQTPQDYREWEGDSYFRRLYWSYAYFFDVSQRSRNERNGAIFGGTMGLIRRDALVEVGSWDEWCITEDAELSLRLLRAGWSGTHVEESFGRGIMPLTFEALKRQRFRWCFGGVQILRMHLRHLLPGPRTTDNRLTLGQRWAYFVGGLQWFGDLAGLFFTGFLLLGAVNLAVGDGLVVRRYAVPILVAVLGLLVLGVLRSLALLRRIGRTGWLEAIGAHCLWLGLGWAVALASVRGLLAREGAFLRTPKVRGDVSWRDAIRGNLVETGLAVVCLLGIGAAIAGAVAGRGSGWVVALLLTVQGAGYLAAPLNSLAAIRADLTPELRRRRREKLISWARVAPGVRRYGVGPVLAVAAALVGITLVATPVGGPRIEELPRVIQSEPSDGATLGPDERTPQPSTSSSPDDASTVPATTATRSPARTGSTATGTRSATPTAAPETPAAEPSALPTQAQPTTRSPKPTTQPTERPTQGQKPSTRPTPPDKTRLPPTPGRPNG